MDTKKFLEEYLSDLKGGEVNLIDFTNKGTVIEVEAQRHNMYGKGYFKENVDLLDLLVFIHKSLKDAHD